MDNQLYAPNRASQAMQLNAAGMELDRVEVTHSSVQPRCLVTLTDQNGMGAGRFRALAIRLRNSQKRQQLKKLLITSSVKGEGKSIVSANLAVALAQGQRTLLIDCDLHHAGLRDVLGIHSQAGLGDWWRSSDPILNFMRRMDRTSLWYLSAGHVTEPPLEILQSQRFSEMIHQISRWFDWVILDSPPLLPVPDSNLLAAQTDGTLLIVRHASTPKPLLKEVLKIENLKVLGIVANAWQSSSQRYYAEYYTGYNENRDLPAAR